MTKQLPIVLKNVRVHNLKGVDLTLSPHQLIVFTGVSGCGKSSLAFDTIYIEGQRRYIESLSTYARRHMEIFQSLMQNRSLEFLQRLRLSKKALEKIQGQQLEH